MSITPKAALWAAAIIAFAFLANGWGWDRGMSLVIVFGLAAIAVTHLYRGRRADCPKER